MTAKIEYTDIVKNPIDMSRNCIVDRITHQVHWFICHNSFITVVNTVNNTNEIFSLDDLSELNKKYCYAEYHILKKVMLRNKTTTKLTAYLKENGYYDAVTKDKIFEVLLHVQREFDLGNIVLEYRAIVSIDSVEFMLSNLGNLRILNTDSNALYDAEDVYVKYFESEEKYVKMNVNITKDIENHYKILKLVCVEAGKVV